MQRRFTPGIVLGWMPTSQRSTTLAERLGFELALFGRPGFRRRFTAPFVYPILAVRSAHLLLRRRPRALVVVAPPFVAPLVAIPIARAIGARSAVDIHSGALLDRRWRWSTPILRMIVRLAGAAVVTLPSLAELLRASRARTLVVPDPLPCLTPSPEDSEGGSGSDQEGGSPTVVAVCGWGDDEPLTELAAAARGRSWRLLVTGRPRRRIDWPPNARLTGFLSHQAYVDTIASADLVVVLTLRDDTLLSGAWEALALGRPLLVSATPALVATFGPEIASVQPTADGIAGSIETALRGSAAARQRSIVTRERLRQANDEALAKLAAILKVPIPDECPSEISVDSPQGGPDSTLSSA